ncbi:hypothetical protein [Intestinimonas butyriciproducens]|uniref:hypothetical protein n=1 Tax=Intestinimonas butyriciproducens TaxID=1297617 RepID=UPI0019584DAD|nr:hypothetical protein [Intestinimonas butyriciproducens]MBM6975933.1 hypothetical protein [Intestinimonas butyriciproducens]
MNLKMNPKINFSGHAPQMNPNDFCFSLLYYIRLYQKKNPWNHCGSRDFLKSQRLLNWGARRAALRPYLFRAPGGHGRPGTPY